MHSSLPGFAPRKSQQQMAEMVFDAIQSSGTLVCESGTGTGKTYAYLAPALLSGKRTVISTATRALQEQIYCRDLPTIAKALKSEIKTCMLKGRSNYLCRYRLRQTHQQTDLIGVAMKHPLSQISEWAAFTESGDISEVQDVPEQSPVWRAVTSTSENCLGGHCPDFHKCHVNTARKKALDSDLVVINHHVYFSDASLKEEGFGGMLPNHEVVIFDEAHGLPDIASHFFGFTVSSTQIKHLIEDIESAEKEENSSVDFNPIFRTLDQAVKKLIKIANANYQGPEIFEEVRNRKWDEATSSLKQALEGLHVALQQAAAAGTGLSRCRDRTAWMLGNLWTWCDDSQQDSACWFAAGKNWFRLNSTPLEVAKHLHKQMNDPHKSRIFVSATLTVDQDFHPFIDKVGLSERETDAGYWESPYDYSRNSRLLVPQDMPEPNAPEFPETLKQLILEIGKLSRGRAFCLFTSFAMLNRVHDLVRAEVDWPLYKQGDLQKQSLIEKFIENEHAMLFGTTTFWQGVDIKGDALSCVIIDRLPFGSPAEPVMKSRIRNCNNQGGNSFAQLQLPEAVVALKQGAGRLIRSEKDRGVLVICDPRILDKPYGKVFLASLPPMPLVRKTSDIASFFRKSRA